MRYLLCHGPPPLLAIPLLALPAVSHAAAVGHVGTAHAAAAVGHATLLDIPDMFMGPPAPGRPARPWLPVPLEAAHEFARNRVAVD